MALFKPTHIQRMLAISLPDSLIEKLAIYTEAVQRERKVDIVLLVWTLVLGFSNGTRRKIASLRRQYQQASGTTIARSSFHDRLNVRLERLMKMLVDWMLKLRAEKTVREVSSRFQGFRELLACDSTVFRLHDLLREELPSTQDGQAAAKLHVVANVIEGKPNKIRLTGQTTHDTGPWKKLGGWVRDSLLLLDLGYYDFHLFHRIMQQGGYFISRVKKNANPLIVASNQTCVGNSIDLTQTQLQDILPRLQRKVIDVTVEVDVQLRKYRGRRRTIQKQFRMVGVRNDETNEYHLYFTNISPDVLTARQIAMTYHLRWQVELLFCRLKSIYRLHQVPTSQEHILKIMLYASILALLVSNVLLKSMRQLAPKRIIPARRMDAVFSDFASLILLAIASERRDRPLDLFELLMAEAIDPNIDRPRSHDFLRPIPLQDPTDIQAFTTSLGP